MEVLDLVLNPLLMKVEILLLYRRICLFVDSSVASCFRVSSNFIISGGKSHVFIRAYDLIIDSLSYWGDHLADVLNCVCSFCWLILINVDN